MRVLGLVILQLLELSYAREGHIRLDPTLALRADGLAIIGALLGKAEIYFLQEIQIVVVVWGDASRIANIGVDSRQILNLRFQHLSFLILSKWGLDEVYLVEHRAGLFDL